MRPGEMCVRVSGPAASMVPGERSGTSGVRRSGGGVSETLRCTGRRRVGAAGAEGGEVPRCPVADVGRCVSVGIFSAVRLGGRLFCINFVPCQYDSTVWRFC